MEVDVIKELIKNIAEATKADNDAGSAGFNDLHVEKESQQEDVDDMPIVNQNQINALLQKESGLQNLAERKHLLNILKRLFSIQLIFMNVIVAVLVFWIIFDIPFLNCFDVNLLNEVSSFVKFYISAVLVEMLSGIIYMVHRVFSTKIYK